MDLRSEGRQYESERLLEKDAPDAPLELFSLWLGEALDARLLDATAMVIATANGEGRPNARVVLLKGQDSSGFVFFTRYSTQKSVELAENPRATLLFHWRELDRQVRIDATVSRIPHSESEAYFATRPRGSQLAARAASGLGRVSLDDPLEQRFEREDLTFVGREVPMPEDWGGYRAVPRAIEFWQGRPNRLHDRLVYELEPAGTWCRYRLAP